MSDAFESWLNTVVDQVRNPTPDEYLISCPKCGAQGRCYLNPTKRLYHCMKCGGGLLVHWMGEVFGIPSYVAADILDDKADINVADYDSAVNSIDLPAHRDDPTGPTEDIIAEIRGFRHIGYGDAFVDNLCAPYLLDRGYNLEYARLWRLMFAPGGRFAGRLVLPVLNSLGEMTYFQARTIFTSDDSDEPKYRNPSARDGMGRNNAVFNLDSAERYRHDTLYVCEGAFNAMAIGVNAIALFGKTLSESQWSQIASKITRGTKIVVCFDHGTGKETARAAQRLSSVFTSMSYVQMPDTRDYNDWHIRGGHAAVLDVIAKYERPLNNASDLMRLMMVG